MYNILEGLNDQLVKRDSQSEEILLPAGNNPRYINPIEAQQVINSASDERRVQDEEALTERNGNPLQAILEGELESWNLDMALLPVSTYSGEGDRSGGPESEQQQSFNHRRHHLHHVKLDTLKERIALLSMPVQYESNLNLNMPNEMVQALPNEVLMLVFSFLDDISLYSVGNVCRRWHQLLISQTTSAQWQTYTRRRWPLYRPLCPATDWFTVYSSLVSSNIGSSGRI
jgi:hypothetical protein